MKANNLFIKLSVALFFISFTADSKAALTVLLLPEGALENSSVTGKSLDSWPKSSANK